MQVPLGPFYSDPTEKIKFKIDGFFLKVAAQCLKNNFGAKIQIVVTN